MNILDEQIEEKINEMVNTYDDDAKHALLSLLESIEQKQAGKYKTYLAAFMGISSRLIDDDTYESVIPNRELIHNPLKITHGGITAALMDIAMGSLVHQFIPDQQAAVTSEMKIHFLSAGTGDELRCRAHAVLKTEDRWVVQAKVFRADQKLIALATGTFIIVPKMV